MAKTLNPVDVMVKLSTILSPYLTRKVVGFQVRLMVSFETLTQILFS